MKTESLKFEFPELDEEFTKTIVGGGGYFDPEGKQPQFDLSSPPPIERPEAPDELDPRPYSVTYKDDMAGGEELHEMGDQDDPNQAQADDGEDNRPPTNGTVSITDLSKISINEEVNLNHKDNDIYYKVYSNTSIEITVTLLSNEVFKLPVIIKVGDDSVQGTVTNTIDTRVSEDNQLRMNATSKTGNFGITIAVPSYSGTFDFEIDIRQN